MNLLLNLFSIFLDNAYDPDVKASMMDINCQNYGDKKLLTFLDNGNGMDAKALHLMLR